MMLTCMNVVLNKPIAENQDSELQKKLSCTLLFLFCFIWYTNAQPYKAVHELAQRRVPWLAKNLVLTVIPQQKGQDVFELSSVKHTIKIAASSGSAAAAGLNWYLNKFCHRSLSHMGDNLAPLKALPLLKDTVRIVSPFQYRYALNYCTINYTMSFYEWVDWERELDWMALNGFNLVLMPVGMEMVWQNTLRKMNFSQAEIKEFIPGPAFTAWWLMGNLEGWGGPVSQNIINQQAILARKIVARMNALGIQPVIQGFYGMVPTSLKKKMAGVQVIGQGKWAGGFTRPDFLLPQDSLFRKMAALYYTEIKNLYGSNIQFFGGEPFHEGGITSGIDVSESTSQVQQIMQHHFPQSTWVLQGWQNNPSKEFLKKLDKKHTLVIELFGENTRTWERRKGYENTPFVWSHVSNFGEKNGLYGRLQRFAEEVHYARSSLYAPLLKGIGIIPEGINNNPVVYEFTASLAWQQDSVDVKQWVKSYIQSRYGFENDALHQAWQLLLQTVYSSPPVQQEGPSESIFCARPGLGIQSVSSWGTRKRNYDTVLFEKAVRLFVEAGNNRQAYSETYEVDKIDLVRQLQSNRADGVYKSMVDAVVKKDRGSFLNTYTCFETMLLQQDSLLSGSEYFSLNRWLRQASRFAKKKEDRVQAIRNAKIQISYWGADNRQTNLHDYAHKEWGGLLSTLYLSRWRLFRADMLAVIAGDKANADYFSVEKNWADEPRSTFDKNIGHTRDFLIQRMLR